MTPNNFIIIRGCPRSGTYLLARLMQENFSVAIPVESQFIELFHRYRFLFGNMATLRNRTIVLNAIFDYLELLLFRGFQLKEPGEHVRISLLSVRDARNEILSGVSTYEDLVHALFAAYAKRLGCERYVDKSVLFNPVPIKAFQEAIPGTKCIHILRDGRDVALSWCKEWFGPASVSHAADLWCRHVAEIDASKAAFPENNFTVKYEDLVQEPNRCLMEIGSFLGLPPRSPNVKGADMEQFNKVLSQDYHKDLSGPVNSKNINKWQQDMSAHDVETFDSIAGHMLSRHGYPAATRDKRYVFPAWRFSLAFRLVTYRRIIRNLLPAALLLRRKLGARNGFVADAAQ